MKGRTSAATIGLVGGLALGVWIGSEMTSGRQASTTGPAAVTAQAADESAVASQTEKPKRSTRVARVNKSAANALEAPAPESPKLVMTIPVSAPELHERMKPVLARGTKMPIAIEGFTSAEQFATLAHAAKNTEVPFILLKHRVLTEGQSLEAAILASKPEADAKGEVTRARAAAKSDIAAVTPQLAALSSSE